MFLFRVPDIANEQLVKATNVDGVINFAKNLNGLRENVFRRSLAGSTENIRVSNSFLERLA